jgi:hypothetical protein
MLSTDATPILTRDVEIGHTQRLYVTVQVGSFNSDDTSPHSATFFLKVGSQQGAPVTIQLGPKREEYRFIYQCFYGLPEGPLPVEVMASADASDHVALVEVSMGTHG